MSSIFRILQTSRPRLYNILKELASFFFFNLRRKILGWLQD